MWRIVVILGLLSGGVSGPQAAEYPAFQNASRYLCCTTRFDEDDVANDGGYRHEKGVTIQSGTPVTVVADDEHVLVIEGGTPRRFYLKFRFGRRVMPTEEYFALLLPDHDPRSGASGATVLAAIAEGRLLVGMTRDEAIQARGYPPMNHTPDRAADRWIYFDNRDDVVEVRFQDGRIAAMTPGKEEDLPDPGER